MSDKIWFDMSGELSSIRKECSDERKETSDIRSSTLKGTSHSSFLFGRFESEIIILGLESILEIHGHALRKQPQRKCKDIFINGKIFKRKNKVNQYSKNVHSKTRWCGICCREFSAKYLKDHIKRKHRDKVLHILEKKKQKYIKHSIEKQTNEYICVICDSAFRHQDELHKHSRTHQGPLEICPICEVGLDSEEDVKIHRKNNHESI